MLLLTTRCRPGWQSRHCRISK